MTERLLRTSADAPVPEFLYRIFPLKRFCEAFSMGTNTLVLPALWDDTFEAAQLRTQIRNPLYGRKREDGLYDGSTSPGVYGNDIVGYWTQSTNVANNVYCQCWSATAESDAMWRIYSQDLSSVKVRVRTADLLAQTVSAMPQENVFLGEVQYLQEAALESEIQDVRKNHLIQRRPDRYPGLYGEGIARVLLKKRQQFAHENEYRLIVVRLGPGQAADPAKFIQYSVEPVQLFLDIELDPRLTDEQPVRAALSEAGFKGAVTKSALYRRPNLIHPPR